MKNKKVKSEYTKQNMAVLKKRLNLFEEEELIKMSGNILFCMSKVIKDIWRKTHMAAYM